MGRVATSGGAVHEPALLERAAFAEALDESLASVASGVGRLVLLSGEAGVGKSVLVRRFCDARSADTRVMWGACDALQTPRPLSPFIDIAATAQGAVLTSVRNGEKPYQVFLALTEELGVVTPTIAVVEDVHWADEATLDVIRLLARRAETLGALVVVTYRDDGLDAAHPVRLAVGELGTAPGVVQLRLPPLSRGAVEELAGPHGVDAEELYVKTAGNPFFVTEVLAGGGTALPPTVRDAVLGRMSRLGAAARARARGGGGRPAPRRAVGARRGRARRCSARRHMPRRGYVARQRSYGVVPSRTRTVCGRAVDRPASARHAPPAGAAGAAQPARGNT